MMKFLITGNRLRVFFAVAVAGLIVALVPSTATAQRGPVEEEGRGQGRRGLEERRPFAGGVVRGKEGGRDWKRGQFRGEKREHSGMMKRLHRLKKENPEEFEELQELRREDPEAFRARIRAMIHKRSPVGREHGELKELYREYHKAEDPDEKEEIEEEMREIAKEIFNKRVEESEERLTQMEEKLEDLRERLKKRKAHRGEIIDRKLERLTRDPDLEW